MNRKVPLLLLLLSVLSSCKKYEEGPALSLRSKKNRLENTWKYEKKFLNKEEQVLNADDQKYRIRFDKEGRAIKEVANASGPASFVGSWEFTDHKETLITAFNYTYFGNPVNEINRYTILKLKNKELWLFEINVNSDTCEYHFIPG